MMDENRKFIRFNCLLSGKARLQDRSINNAEVKNFSRKGLFLTLPDSNGSLKGEVEVLLRNHKSEIMDYVYSVWRRRKQNEKYGSINLEKNH